MKKRLLIPLISAPLVLSSCGTTGPLPEFGKVTQAEWIVTDFDGKAGDEYIITSSLQDIVFNNRGEIIGWYVKNYAGTPYIKKRNGSYDFSALKNDRSIANMVNGRKAFAVRAEDVLDPENEAEVSQPVVAAIDKTNHKQQISFKYLQNGQTVVKNFILHSNSFEIKAETKVMPNEGTAPLDRIEMDFAGLGRATNPIVQAVPQGGGQPASVQGSGVTSVENLLYASIQEAPSQIAHALVVRPDEGQNVKAKISGGDKSLLSLNLPAESKLGVYGGKNELIHLYQTGYLELPYLFQPNFFGQISLWLVKIMEGLYSVLQNWGIVIIALTIILRMAMWPLMQTQARTSARMQVMQPELKALQTKYEGKTDIESRQQMQKEMQELYTKHGVNPAGCLSAFLPMPILIALWSTIRNFEFDTGFLWLPDLAIPDPFFILAVLYVIVNVAQIYLATRKTPEMFKQQIVMYVFFAYFALTFPSGVSLYLVISTFIGVIQQWIVNKQVEAEADRLGGVGVTVEPLSKNNKRKSLGE